MAKGELPERFNISKVIVDGYKDGVMIAGAWYLELEYFAGPHDMIGGQMVGLYDRDGNARRDRNGVVSTFHKGWTVVAIPVAAPFAMAKGLPPNVWQAITTLVRAAP